MNKFITKMLGLILAIAIPTAILAEVPQADIWTRAAYGRMPGISRVLLHGFNASITTTYEMLWPESAAYTPLLVAMSTPYCASSDANDAAAGTGARTISVTGLNTSFARFTETVTLNGTSSVNLATTNVLVIDSIEVLTAGSGLVNAGIIQCGTGANTGGDPAVTHAYLAIGSTTTRGGGGLKSQVFLYGVPANKTLICRNITVSSLHATAANAEEFVIDYYTNLGLLKRAITLYVEPGGGNPSAYQGTLVFPEKTIIVGKAAAASSTGPSSMSAECLLIDATSSNANQTVF